MQDQNNKPEQREEEAIRRLLAQVTSTPEEPKASPGTHRPTMAESIVALAGVPKADPKAWTALTRQQWLDAARWIIPSLVSASIGWIIYLNRIG